MPRLQQGVQERSIGHCTARVGIEALQPLPRHAQLFGEATLEAVIWPTESIG